MTLRREPIAIVGIGCRFPGAADPDSYWRLLVSGKDAITEIPKDRFDLDAFFDPRPATPGKVSTRYGGFLPDIDRFDAEYFGISPAKPSDSIHSSASCSRSPTRHSTTRVCHGNGWQGLRPGSSWGCG